MAKRLTGTEKWDKSWFRKLSPRHKALWEYLRDKCDQAGMWEVDFESASHYINDATPITIEDLKVFGTRLERYGSDKIWIVDFVSFQCGELSRKCAAHKPVFKLLTKYNLLDRVLNSLSNRLQEIEMKIEKEEELEMKKEGGEFSIDFVPNSEKSIVIAAVDVINPEPLNPFLQREKDILIAKISDYFAVRPILKSDLYDSICDFVDTSAAKQELKQVAASLEGYRAYKARSQETRHNVTAWIGTKESHYQDGQWAMIDWVAKNKNLTSKNTADVVTERKRKFEQS